MPLAKSRVVNFFANADAVPEIVKAIDEEVLPRFSSLPHFLGFVALESEAGPRVEIVGISMWLAGLEESEAVSEEFRDEILRLTGTTPARKGYNIRRVMVRDANGDLCVDLP